jgi:hypothetical protein
MTYYQSTTDGSVMNLGFNPGAGHIKITIKEGERLQREAARASLLKKLKPGDTVHTILRHVSRSGMMRHISVVIGAEDITWEVALVTGDKRADNGGIKMTGCGMDMGFALVYELGARLWPNGTAAPHGTRNGKPDCDGGYALKQRWL